MMVEKIAGFRLHIGRRNLINLGSDELAVKRIVPGCLGNFHHIIGSGVMLLIVKTVGIVKVCVVAAKLFGALVHQLYEFLHRSADFLSQGQSHFIGRFQHESHEGLFYCKDFPCLCINRRTAGLDAVCCFLGHGDGIVHIQVFTCQQCRHDLRDAGRIKLLICILRIKNTICYCVHQYC